jgi:hypothetical protein
MFERSRFFRYFFLAMIIVPAMHASSQCTNRTAMLPLAPMKAAANPRNFVRYKYRLSDTDSIQIESHEDTETSIGPYDLGFLIKRSGSTVRQIHLRRLPEFRKQESFFSKAFSTLAITRVCEHDAPMYFITMKYMGDELSPALVFVVSPSGTSYGVLALPMFSGGTIDVSKSAPNRIRIWNNLNEGACNACETRYRVTEYELLSNKAVRLRSYRTRHLYTSGEFDDVRVRFVP